MPSGRRVTTIPRTRKAAVSTVAQNSADLLKIVEKSLDDDKAEHVVVVDLQKKSSIADYMVIATGRNSRQLAAMASHLDQKLSRAGVKRVAIEGMTQGDWVLLDGGDIIVHMFRPEIRGFYNLEKMWGADAPSPDRLTAVG